MAGRNFAGPDAGKGAPGRRFRQMLEGGLVVALLQQLTALGRAQRALAPPAHCADRPAAIGDGGDSCGIAGAGIQGGNSAVHTGERLLCVLHFFLWKQAHLDLLQGVPEGVANQLKLHACRACIMKKLVLRSCSSVVEPIWPGRTV